MRSETLRRLMSGEGTEALASAARLDPREEDFLRDFSALRRAGLDEDLARAALETVLLRKRATGKFTRASEMFFEREALEQSSSEACARHRAARFRGARRIADLGCGIGGDAMALAEHAPLLGVDRSPLRLQMARRNLAVCRPEADASWWAGDLALPGFGGWFGRAGAAVFCDPARREEHRRVFHVDEYSPPWRVLEEWRTRNPGLALCVKLSPGVQVKEIDAGNPEVEFVSLDGELKEAVAWFGPLRTTARRATMLPSGETLTETEAEDHRISGVKEFLYEPDPSVLRAGLVRQLAARLGAARFDPEIAYLTAPDLRPTAWARAYRIEEAMPFGLKRLREWLRARNIGRVIIKKRGSAVDTAELEHRLRLAGSGERMLFLTRAAGKPVVLVGTGTV